MIYLYRGTCAAVCAAGYVNETMQVICQSAKIKDSEINSPDSHDPQSFAVVK